MIYEFFENEWNEAKETIDKKLKSNVVNGHLI